mgnify:CR=1 FL=1
MDLNAILDQVMKAMNGNGGFVALAVTVLVYLLRAGIIKLPWAIPLLSPAPVDPVKSLRDRLRDLAEERFKELTDAGDDPDDVYKFLLDRMWDEPK